MRLGSLFLWDIRFQAKHGFYFLYAVLTVLYVAVLFAVPESWKEKTAAILIFSDPASMGLFFMGAIILLEKSQHTPCAFAVSPVCPMEYIIAEVSSLSAISLAAAVVLASAAGADNLHIVLLGTAISSMIFTLFGIIIATKISSLNQFILWTVPIEIVCFGPAILHLFKITPAWLRYYPVNVCMEMVSGGTPSAMGILIVMALLAILFILSKHCVLKMWSSTGGVKL
ncbi:MAG: ABC transporter permease [Acetatifactor sp.]|nr:ABC transporter permease [Acetatifactor sp.]